MSDPSPRAPTPAPAGRLAAPIARHPGATLAALLAAGLLVRLAIAGLSIGSNDAKTWLRYATFVHENGLLETYRQIRLFNHGPLMGHLSVLSLRVAEATGLPFFFVFKLPMIAADLLAAVLLWRVWAARAGLATAALAAGLFLANPTSLLVTAYHCNTDTLCAVLCLASALALHRARPALGGLLLGAAINVKLIPVVLVPVFALTRTGRRDFLRFGLALSLGALPFVPILLEAAAEYHRNAITYNSRPNPWGVFYLLDPDHGILPEELRATLARLYLPGGRYLILASSLALGVWARLRGRWNALELGALTMSLFMVLLPGFSVQYTLYPVPLLFAVSLAWGGAYSLVAGVFVGILYVERWTGGWPAFSLFGPAWEGPALVFGLLAWATLVSFLAVGLGAGQGFGRTRKIDQSPASPAAG